MADNVIVTCNLSELKHKEYGVMRQDWFESNNCKVQEVERSEWIFIW